MISLEKLGIIIAIIVTIIALITYIWFTIRYKNVLYIYMIYVLMSIPVFVCTFNITLLIMLLLY